MNRLASGDRETIEELSRELATVRLDAPDMFAAHLPRLRAFLELDNLVLFCPTERLCGWGLEFLYSDNLPNASLFAERLAMFLDHAPQHFWFFDAVRPETEQRNLVLETARYAGEDAYRASAVHRDLLEPLHLDFRRELRVLVCEGPRLLAWFGAFHDGQITQLHCDRIAALLPALRRRLLAERALCPRQRTVAGLSTTLEELDDAAFVIGAAGELMAVNRAGRSRLELDRAETVAHVTRSSANAGRLDTRVHGAADRWQLTRRQRDVLELVVRGRCNASIAEELGVGERAVELHVTALLDRARVSSRASLVSLVLGALVLD